MTDLTRRDAMALTAAAAILPTATIAREGAQAMLDQTTTSKIVSRDDYRQIPFPLHPISQVVGSGDMPSGVSFFHSAIPAGAPGAPPHLHEHEDEVYFILSGTAHFLIGDRVEAAGPGAAVILPRGDWHANWNEGSEEVWSLVFVSQNSKFEHFFDDVARRIMEAGITDPMEAGKTVAMAGADYGVTVDMSKLPDRAKPFFGMG